MDHQTTAGGLFILERVISTARRTVPQVSKIQLLLHIYSSQVEWFGFQVVC